MSYKPTSSTTTKGSFNSKLDSSINSGMQALEMSYNNPTTSKKSDSEALTAEEQEEVSKLPKSTWSTFISPSERKRRAKMKEEAKKLDFVALNGPEAQGAEQSSLVVLGRDGSRVDLGPAAKASLARGLVRATLG